MWGSFTQNSQLEVEPVYEQWDEWQILEHLIYSNPGGIERVGAQLRKCRECIGYDLLEDLLGHIGLIHNLAWDTKASIVQRIMML